MNIKKQFEEEIPVLNLPTTYFCISLPLVDKFKAIAVFTKKIREAEEKYNGARI